MPLDHASIQDAAFAAIDERGLASFSLRALAATLRVEPMSLYHWYPSKAALLDALLDRVIGAIEVPEDGPWDDRLRRAAHSFRAAVTRHPGFAAHVLVHRLNTRVGLGFLDRLLGVYVAAGFAPWKRAAAFRMMGHWLAGVCLDEVAGYAKGPSAVDPPSGEEVFERWPNVVALGPYNTPEHRDRLFEAGLEELLAAHRRMLAAA